MASTLTVKAFLNRPGNPQEIRRFSVDEGASTSYDYLRRKVGQVFQGLDNITLAWKDAEGDLVVFSSDDELMEALGFVTDAVFRLYIRKNDDNTSGNTSSGTVHPNIICDGCQQHVIGVRYKCMVCPDYDLCGTCEGQGKHSDHHMIRLRSPVSPGWTPSGFGGPPFGSPPFGGPPFGGPPFGGHPCGGPPFGGPPRHFRRMMRRFWHQMASENSGNDETGEGCHKRGRRCKDGAQKSENKKKPEAEKPPTDNGNCENGEASTSGDYLTSVGEQVAAMLEPLGIDTEVEVEHQGDRRRCGGGGGHHGYGPWSRGGWRGRGGHRGPWWAQFHRHQPWRQDGAAEQAEAQDQGKPAAESTANASDIPMPGSPHSNDAEWTVLNKDKEVGNSRHHHQCIHRFLHNPPTAE